MKPTSIVSLVVAVLLVVVGLVTCFIAQNMAQANGEFLFSEQRDNDLVQTVKLDNSEISKIELIVQDAEINIYGRSEESYIEFINFRENYYALSASNRVLSFDEIPDVMSMLKFWENGFSFKGMRYILNFNNQPEEDKAKVINIYLATDREIKIFDINAERCTLNINNIASSTDYNIVATEADITANTVQTASTFNINSGENDSPAERITLNMNTAIISNISVNAKDLQLIADYFRCNGNGNIVCSTGLIDISTIRRVSEMYLNLSSDSGVITVEGEQVLSPYTNVGTQSTTNLFRIQTGSADISMKLFDSSSSSGE